MTRDEKFCANVATLQKRLEVAKRKSQSLPDAALEQLDYQVRDLASLVDVLFGNEGIQVGEAKKASVR